MEPIRIADEVTAGDPLDVELTDGELEVLGRLPTASNATFLARLQRSSGDVLCVYKPFAGERPLWDFPDRTLGLREVAAHALSRACGFDVVPRTELVDGPLGPGSLQAWVAGEDPGDDVVDLRPVAEADQPGWFAVLEGLDAAGDEVVVVHADDTRLRRLALFDVVANNADRKGGHILTHRGGVFGVDHGLTFHPEPKLRTLLWGWAGAELDADERALLERVETEGAGALEPLLDSEEVTATRRRARRLLQTGHLPAHDPHRPAVPWPPF